MSRLRSIGVLAAAVLLAGAAGCVEASMEEELDMDLDDDAIMPVPLPERVEVEPLPDDGRDYGTWPRSDDPRQARIGGRQVRTYPLWPTPIDEPCPTVLLGSFGPPLEGGPMFERVTARLADVTDPRLDVVPTEIIVVRDHVGIGGLRLVAAANTSSACMMGWHHTHCFASATDTYCPDGTAADLERLVRSYGLVPSSLSAAGWMELAVVLSGVERLVVEPSLVRECTPVEGVTARSPSVEVEPGRVTIRFTAITRGQGADHTVVVTREGGVTTSAQTRWPAPPEPDF